MDSKVTVIIPTYNRSQVLERAILSVESQTFCGWELVIVDDGSTDETESVLKKWQSHPQIQILKQQNKGVSAARNRALSNVKSEWVAFLDSDDEWLPEKLEKQIEYAQSHPDLPLIHGEEIWIRNGVRVNPMKKHKKSGGDVFDDSLKLCCISPSTALLKYSVLQEVGFFREDFPVCEDYDLWLKITGHYQIGFIQDPLIIKYGGHEDQLSRKFRAMDYWRILSMVSILDDEHLSKDKKEKLKEELNKKIKILLKGYRKHQNLSFYDEVFSYQFK